MAFDIRPEFTPGAPGGVCFICKSARRQDDVVVDCLVDPEDLNWVVPTSIPGMAFELATGSLEICSSCWIEAAQELGMVSAEKAAALKDKVQTLTRLLDVASAELELADRTIAQMRRYDEIKGLANNLFGPEPI